MPTTTVADLKTCKRIKDVQLRIELSDDSDIRGIARQLETFREDDQPLCNIVLADAHTEHVRDWTAPEAMHLFEAMGSLPNLVHLAFESLGTGKSEEEEAHVEGLSAFPVTLMTALLQKTAPRLESLVMESVTLTGTAAALDIYAQTIASLKCLRSCIITSNFDMTAVDLGEEEDPSFPLDGIVTAIAQLPLLVEADLVTYAWYESGFPFQFKSSEPLKDLIQSPNLQELTLGEFHLANEGLKDVGRSLATNKSLKRLELHFAPSPTRTCMATLTLLANALMTNTTLEIFKLEFEESCPKLDSFLIKMAEALAKNPKSALQKLKVTSPFTYGADVEEAFCTTLQSNYSMRRLEFMTMLDGEEEDENYTCLDGRKRTEIDLYLRLNARGRAKLIQGNGVSRAKWIQTFAHLTHDVDALHYYLRTNPWLCHEEEEAPMAMDTTPAATWSTGDNSAMLQGLQQMIAAGFQSTQGQIHQLNKKVDTMNKQHAREKKRLEDEVLQLRKVVSSLMSRNE